MTNAYAPIRRVLMRSALPAALLRDAAEMDRGPASSLGFAALALGAGLGALLSLVAA